jgi:hypothetical protein
MALRMKKNAVFGAVRTTHHAGNAVGKAPAGDPSDFCIAHRAEPAWFMPEKTKGTSTPKRCLHMGAFALFEVGLPSSRPPLLGASPLRTGRDSFLSSGSGPSNASFRETRFRYGNMLAMNPVVALWMEQDAVICIRGTTHHTRDAIVNAPTRDPGDPGVAHGTGPALKLPEKAKSPRTPKRFRHMIFFAFLEVGFMGHIVRISWRERTSITRTQRCSYSPCHGSSNSCLGNNGRPFCTK